jgi:D-sedoheptulose 7-phosphate isomerase
MDDQAMNDKIQKTLNECSAMVRQLLVEIIAEATSLIITALRKGNKLLLCGNGGSAADAQHIAGELVGRFFKERQALPAIALNTNVSIVTALGNDYGFEKTFSRQVEALGTAGDVLLAISTSGNSPNVLDAILKGREKDIKAIGLTGASGGRMRELCDICICVPSEITPRIQEMHILTGHIICQLVEEELFP